MLRNLSKEQEGLVREFLLRGRQLNAAEEREALDCVAQMLFSRVPPGMRDAPLLSPEYSLPDWVCYRIADFFHSDDGPIAIRPVTEFRDGDRDMHIAAYIHELTANKNIKWEAAV
jgi:hypothetical protein